MEKLVTAANQAMEKLEIGGENIKEGECSTPELIDFISKMPNDILVKILARLPLKRAVATGSLSTRWRFVWCDLKNLDIDGTEMLENMAGKDGELCVVERVKFVKQVNSVIQSHSNPKVNFFRICFDLDKTYSKDIDNWVWFALDKKVEVLQLDLSGHNTRATKENYDFPLPLSDGKMVRLSEWPSSNSMVVDTLSLQQLFLMRVNVSKLTLVEVLKNSPHLEVLYIYGSSLLTHVNFGGPDINLKHFMLMGCLEVKSISLYDCDLEKFNYLGHDIDMHFMNLPKIKEVDIGRVSVGLNNKVFRMISSIASNLEVLSLNIARELEDLNQKSIPVLPNVKTLKLTLPTQYHDSILEFAEIAKACPRLETFTISLHWCMPNTRRKAQYVAVGHSFKHLTCFEIGGYCGRISDFQFALYIIGNAAYSLKKFVIDPSLHPYDEDVLTAEESLEREETGRTHAESELAPCLPPWVELTVL